MMLGRGDEIILCYLSSPCRKRGAELLGRTLENQIRSYFRERGRACELTR